MAIVQQPQDPELTVMDAAPTPLHAMRRKELERMLVYNGEHVKPGATSTLMISQAQDLMDSGGTLKIPPAAWRMPDQTKQTEETIAALNAPPGSKPIDGMTLKELRSHAKDLGIKQPFGAKKADLLELLRGQDAS